MQNESYLYVFNTNQTLVGRLLQKEQTFEFKYAKSYLSSNTAHAINPIHLPLTDKVYFSNNGLTGDLASFEDSRPGIWGRHVLDACHHKKLTDFELLLENQLDRVGNLIFSKTPSFPDLKHSYLKEPFEWSKIISAKEEFEKTNHFSARNAELFKQGASQGGARPKLTVIKNGDLYLAKLPTIRDYVNIAQIEHGTLSLAKFVGINTVESELIKLSKNIDIFLTKRFDYQENNKLAYLSMKSLLSVEHSIQASYAGFSLELKRLNGGLDSTEIFKRMAFNVLISNHDDHYQNHAIYFKNNLWRLTPAFDIVAGEGTRRTQAISIGSFGNKPSIENILSHASDFDLTISAAETIVNEMINNIKTTWQQIFRQAGVEEGVIKSINWAMLDCIKS